MQNSEHSKTKVMFVFCPPKKMPKLGELSENVSPPLGILYLASYARKYMPNLDVRAIDGVRKGWDYTLKKIAEFQPEILCVSYYTVEALSAYELIKIIKAQFPNMLILAGGHHTTAIPFEALKKSPVDIEVYHEGELTCYELIKEFIAKNKKISDMRLDNILGIGYHKGNELKRTALRPYIEDLDTIPWPARDLIDMKEYNGWIITKNSPQARIVISRGCPFHCTFCSNEVWRRKGSATRFRSAKDVADELEFLKKEYGIKEFFDDGDGFNSNIQKGIEICKELQKRNLNMTWKCQLRATPISEELVVEMKKAGCWYVHLGVESANQETLNGVNKKITLEQVMRALELLKKYDIKSSHCSCFITSGKKIISSNLKILKKQ